jgi:glucose/arabinose dehydrogenase
MNLSKFSYLLSRHTHSTAKLAAIALMAIACSLSNDLQAQSIHLGSLEVTLSRPVFNNINSGLRIPASFAAPNDGSGRYFVGSSLSPTPTNLTSPGRIHMFQNGVESSATPFLNLNSEVYSQGLLGMEFHPGYANPADPGYRKFYTYHLVQPNPSADITFNTPGEDITHHNVLTEWQVSATNPNIIDVSTRREIYREAHPRDFEHNGGALDFGPDGYLYVTTGAPPGLHTLAQDLSAIQGKTLRIDPVAPAANPSSLDPISTNGKYRIPASNPFISEPGALDEIYARGLRNPYRMSVDPVTGLVFTGDVGQGTLEEVSVFSAGANLGWPYREGSIPGLTPLPNPAPILTDPIADYGRSDGRSITGGYVYRGSAVPELQGKYIFGEFSFGSGGFGSNPGRLFWLDPYDSAGNLKNPSDVEIFEFRFSDSTVAIFDSFMPKANDQLDITLYSFGVDESGEIYILGEEGNKLTIYKITGAENVSPPGDFDGDLDVDGDDLIQWQGDYGLNENSDADGDGDSDGHDFLLWQRNFGTDLNAPLSAVTVPEPTSIMLGAVLSGIVLTIRPKRIAV